MMAPVDLIDENNLSATKIDKNVRETENLQSNSHKMFITSNNTLENETELSSNKHDAESKTLGNKNNIGLLKTEANDLIREYASDEENSNDSPAEDGISGRKKLNEKILQEQLTLNSEHTINDYVSSSSISTSSLSPLSDVNNSNCESKVSESSDTNSKPNKKSDEVKEQPTTTKLMKAQIATPNSLALHTNLNTSSFKCQDSSARKFSNPKSSSDIIETNFTNNYANSHNVENEELDEENTCTSSTTPSLSNTLYNYQSPTSSTFYNQSNYIKNFSSSTPQLSHQNMGIMLQPPLAVPTASTPDGSNIGTPTTPSTIYVHVDVGHVFQVQMGDEVREIIGPATVRMVSNDGTQPVPIQLNTPSPGQLVQQIVDENGVLTHLILSSQQSNQIPIQSQNIIQSSHMNGNNDGTLQSNDVKQAPKSQQLSQQYCQIQLAQSSSYYHPLSSNTYSQNIQSQYTNTTQTPSHLTLLPNPYQHQLHPQQHIQQLPFQSQNQFQAQQQQHSGLFLNTFVPSPAQSPKQGNINITTNSLATSPLQTNEENPIHHKTLNHNSNNTSGQGQNIKSISPSSSSSCSSVSHTSSRSTDFKSKQSKNFTNSTAFSNSSNKINYQKTLKESRSFRKYNPSSHSTIPDFSHSSKAYFNNSPYFSNIPKSNDLNLPFNNYQVTNNNRISKKPLGNNNNNHLILNQNHLTGKKYQTSLVYQNNNTNSQYNMNDLNDNKQLKNEKLGKIVSKSVLNKEEQEKFDSELEKHIDLYKLVLNSIKKPYVCDIEAQSVLVRLSSVDLDTLVSSDKSKTSTENLKEFDSTPDSINYDEISFKCESVNYTLELANQTNVFNEVYTGDANEITLKDLKPNTKYFLRVFASLGQRCQSEYTDVLSFQTKEAEPDQPMPPKQVGARKKNELTFRWTNPNDNGSKIFNYILEFKEINSKADTEDEENFNEAYKGPLKQFILRKLRPSTCYGFRLSAENIIGRSKFSQVVLASTSGCVPNVPEMPVLKSGTVSSLTLGWEESKYELDYELQMLDVDDKLAVLHGFLNIYNGTASSYTIMSLKGCSNYHFRLRAKNDEGYSAWSDIAKFKTNADVPNFPTKLRVKIQQNQSLNIKVSWAAPTDNGGDEVISYDLQLSDSLENKFESIYNGPKLEHLIEKMLSSGITYYVRVSCSNSIGVSEYSDIFSFLTPSARPGKCSPPRLSNKVKQNSLQIRWSYPENDGGSPVNFYELVNVGVENSEIFYKGSEQSCIINNLLPGRTYSIKLRATNEIGQGDWSDIVNVTTSPGSPDAPEMPNISIRSPSCLLITWTEPSTNGSVISEYRLEWSLKKNESFTQLYTGPYLKYELKGQMQASTRYYFRVQASNVNGSSPFSHLAECITPASVPSIVNSLKLDSSTSDSLTVSWKQPDCNGCPITFYNLDLVDILVPSSQPYIVVNNRQHNCEYKIESLLPDTIYKLRIQANNNVGAGHFSNILKVKTKALPPLPPQLECVSTNYNNIKLKWNHVNQGQNYNNSAYLELNSSSNSRLALNNYQIIYNLEIMSEKSTDGENKSNEAPSFNSIYKGHINSFKANKLLESRKYFFRISASNETCQGEWSDIYMFKTTKSPPVITKSPVIISTNTNSCQVKWQPAKLTMSSTNSDDEDKVKFQESLEYCLQLQSSKKDSEYRDIYKGPENFFHLKDLEPNTEYSLRVCAIRIQDSSSKRLCSSFTPAVSFTTHKLNLKAPQKKSITSNSNSKTHSKMNSKSFLNRFIWPSFYLNLNSSVNSNFKINENDIDVYNSNKSMRKSKNQNALRNFSESYGNTQSNNGRQLSDQHWALFFIIILVLIAFLIAFLSNWLYTSYFEIEFSDEL